jgi:uncharacterized repeat protein (TIGR01451 family)
MVAQRALAFLSTGLLSTSLAAVAVVAPPLATPAAAAPADATITVTIEAVRALDAIDSTDGADFYPDVDIAGETFGGASLEVTDDDDIQPNWQFSKTVPFSTPTATAPVRVTLWDADGALNGPRDHVDITTGDADRDLNLTVNLLSCAQRFPDSGLSGDVPGTCDRGLVTNGDSSTKASMRFRITVTIPDSDGDGLFDTWEVNGYDADGVPPVDVDLPAMGADPNHKDLFLELDATAASRLQREDIYAMKLAFAAAPIDAGTKASELKGGIDAKPNPDGRPGITLHVDTGTIVDTSAREGQQLGTCTNGKDDAGTGATDADDADCSGTGEYLDASIEDPKGANCIDGVDNDADGLADVNDPDCLLSENLGGGSVIAAPNPPACNLDASYYAAKAMAFNPVRASIFRWGLSLGLDPSCAASGGWGEKGGNDFMEFNFDGGTVMHEFGHTLNLDHGGFEGSNCKPNYVSVMNYDNQSGVRRTGGGAILDYEPPRLALDGTSRGSVPGRIDEGSLDENAILDAGDGLNQFIYTDSARAKQPSALNARPDYNNDTDPPYDSGFSGNVDTSDTGGNPGDCTNGSSGSKLDSQNDWLRVSLPFRQFGDAADGPVNPVTTPEMTYKEMVALDNAIASTDLALTKTGPDTAVAGTNLGYTLTVANQGPHAATGTVTDTLPLGTSFVSASPGCVEASPGTVTCGTHQLPPGGTASFTITAAIAADLVYNNGAPLNISNSASVTAVRGTDPDPSDNHAIAVTRVMAQADISVTSSLVDPPTEIIIGKPVAVTISSTTSNGGPSSPMDVRLSTTVSAPAGGSAAPSGQSTVLTAVAVGAPRVATTQVSLNCSEPGQHTFGITTAVTPDRPDDSDPVSANNSSSQQLTVDCVVPVAINIKPGQTPNSVNRNTSSDIPIAVLTTRAGEYGLPLDFDAATIQPLTVRFGPLDVVNAGRGAVETHGQVHLVRSYELDEKTRDADLDGVLHFDPTLAELLPTTVEGCVKGKFTGPAGQTWTFLGCDAVVIIK